ncbi:hypothetical protein BH09SUM1_BH09SUM1_04640 [soil metagenome]
MVIAPPKATLKSLKRGAWIDGEPSEGPLAQGECMLMGCDHPISEDQRVEIDSGTAVIYFWGTMSYKTVVDDKTRITRFCQFRDADGSVKSYPKGNDAK